MIGPRLLPVFRLTLATGLLAIVGAGCAPKGAGPLIKTATQAEIDAVLPEELVAATPVDQAAGARYSAISQILSKCITPQAKELALHCSELSQGPSGKPAERIRKRVLVPALAYWRANRSAFTNIAAILKIGPIQVDASVTASETGDLKSYLKFVDLIRIIWLCSEALFDGRDYDSGTELILLGIRITGRLKDEAHNLLSYMEVALIEGILTGPIDRAAMNPDLPVDCCRQILSAMPPATSRDESLVAALRSEFQIYTRKQLAGDPVKRFCEVVESARSWATSIKDLSKFDIDTKPIAGTYDAIETAKLCASRFEAEMANARRPWSQYDRSSFEAAMASARKLPGAPAFMPEPVIQAQYRKTMNSEPNSMGLVIAAATCYVESTFSFSFRSRAERNAERVLLASSIYRKTHNGEWPSSISDFLPILVTWPEDPYNGKPMIYRPAEHKVYAVGEDLKDGGGDFTYDTLRRTPKDAGFSLIYQPTPASQKRKKKD